jgi:hypothetical protein
MTYMRPMRLFGFLVPLGLALVSGAHAAPLQTPHVEAELVSAVRSIEPGKPFTVALRLKHDEHWHTYWKNPGDSGMATAIQWSLPAGFAAGPIEWPTPRRIPIPPLANFGYDGEIYLLRISGCRRPGAEPRRLPRGQPSGGLQRHLLARRRHLQRFPASRNRHSGGRPALGPAARAGARKRRDS